MPTPKGPPLWAVDLVKRVSRGLTRTQRRLAPPSATLLELVSSAWRPYALWVVAELSVADELSNGPRDVTDIARAVGADEGALYRVLRALAHDGLLTRHGARRFGLTPVTDPLRSDHPLSMRQTVRMSLADYNKRTWTRLLDAVRTGEPQFAALHGGLGAWEWFAQHAPEQGQMFHDAMLEVTRMSIPLILAAHDFGQHRSLLDLGGGQGTLMAAVLATFPRIQRGGVLDLEGALAGAPAVLEQAGVGGRCELITGNLFDEIPAGWRAYLMKNILHGLPDAPLASLLERVRARLEPGARYLVVEMLVPEGSRGIHPSHLDLQMLLASGGRERTAGEYRQLFADHGMRLVEVARTAGPFAVLVCEAR